MTFTPERTTINQRIQLALETTIGTSIAASKQLECFDWTLGINGDIQTYGATGHKYDTVQEENTEWVDLTVSGELDYNGVCYLLGGPMGATTPTASASSVTAKDWVFTPPITGSVAPATYTIEQGDAVRAHKVTYGLLNGFDYSLTRKQVTCSAKGIARPITDAITLTSTPSAIALAPAVGKHFSVYIDPTFGALGTTLLPKALSVNFTFDGVYGSFWPINRANIGFSSHVDLKPATRVKLKIEADAQGMGLLTSLQQGTTQFLRVIAQGNLIASDGGMGTDPVYNGFKHDMAIKIGKPSTFSDDSGIFSIEWDCPVIEDATWGNAQKVTVTNLITAL